MVNALLFVTCVLSAAAIFAAFAVAARGIYFYGRSTDNHQIIQAAASAEQWRTLSGMHKFSGGKAHMKEFAVAALAVTQRFLRDKHSDYPLVFLCLACNTVSAILIYLIALRYWGVEAALLLFVLFISSFWPFLIALWGGVVAVAQVVALAAVYCLQMAQAGGNLLWYGAAGVMLALVLFSSASSRKYLPLVAAAFFWSLRGEFFREGIGTPVIIVLVAVLAAAGMLIKTQGRRLMKMIYTKEGPAFLGRLINNRNRSLDEYMAIMERATSALLKVIAMAIAYVLVSAVLTRSVVYWSAHAALLLGFAVTVFLFVFPNVKQALSGYYMYSQYGKPLWRSRFYTYREFFASIGHPIADDMRGAGWPWLWRYFHLMTPVPLYLCVAGIGLLVFNQVVDFSPMRALGALAVIVLSLSPILMAESSKAVQVGRSYFPAFLGMLFLIGCVFHGPSLLWPVVWLLVAVGAFINAAVLWKDVLPSRMAVNRLVDLLRQKGIKQFYTYDTIYNDVFVHCMPEDVRKEFDIRLIKSINEVKDGYVVVPPVNCKGAMMSDFPIARHSDNTFEDAPLNAMIESKKIENRALAWLPSMNSSRIWVHEAEVSSFRHLILKEITPMDFYRGRAWVLKI